MSQVLKLKPSYENYVTAIQKDLQTGKSHSKLSIEKLAGSLGIDNKNLVKELTELAIVRVAREISHNAELNTRQRYDQIVDLYNHQANLSMRTSQSMMLQQYSTPAPIAFLAGTYILNGSVETPFYLEPSAGNGLLTIALPHEQTMVNEIDEIRRFNLQTQGFYTVLSQNAIEPFRQFDRYGILGSSFDGVITNPPFGTLEKEVMYDEYKFKTLDHLMALRALDTMNDHGRAAIIIGGHTEWDHLGRIQAGKNWIYFNYLYHNYLVDDVINIDGHKLYSRQGTAFNVRLILISGRKETPEGYAPLRQEKDLVVFTFDELWNRVAPFFLGSVTSATDSYSEIEKAKARLRLLKIKLQLSVLNGVHENDENRYVNLVNADFNNNYKLFIENKLSTYFRFFLGLPTKILRQSGFPNTGIYLTARVLSKKLKDHKNSISSKNIFDLPKLLHFPIMILKSKHTEFDSRVVLLKTVGKKGNLIIAVHFINSDQGSVIAEIKSIHDRQNSEVISWIIKDNLLIWANKKEVQNWLLYSGCDSLKSEQIMNLIANIHQKTPKSTL